MEANMDFAYIAGFALLFALAAALAVGCARLGGGK
jgi:hypothetical protein